MDRKKFDIKDSENIGKNFSFEDAVKLYENFKKYFTETPCKELEIIFEGPFDDYWMDIKDTLQKLKSLEGILKTRKASKIDEKKFVVTITFRYLISLEKVTNICKELRQLLEEYESSSIEFNKKQKHVTYTFVKK